MVRKLAMVICGVGLLVASAIPEAAGEPLNVKGVFAPKEQIYYEFPTAQKHFVLFVKRESVLEGSGILDGAAAVEYGMHDIYPGAGGRPRGYVVTTLKDGAQTVIEWEVQATFIPGPTASRSFSTTGSGGSSGALGAWSGSRGRASCTSARCRLKTACSSSREST
ncbi:MAG: hypothetical protein HYV62_09835 [Candidatus Rokubacteria bacterium]|nr:hypothetical protein [Candidatus Rokubacteria bacterium]